MRLFDVLHGAEIEVTDQTVSNELEINGLTCDSRQVEPGFVFAAIPGTQLDGRDFIPDALERGAVCVMAPPGTTVESSAPVLTAANPRRQYALMAANFFETQSRTIAAVTGTNGKTSVVSFLRQIWTRLGHKAASAGTLGIEADGWEKRESLTTPDPADLHRDLRELAEAGVDHLALEASSHGLQQHRLDGVRVSLAAFTNLSRDHLDYHGDMDNYLAAKLRLFTDIIQPGGTVVINADAAHAGDVEAVAVKHGLAVFSFGDKGKDVRLVKADVLADGHRLTLDIGGKSFDVTVPLLGGFQVSNALCALSLAIASGCDADKATRALEQLTGAPGRMQLAGLHPNSAAVYIDFAHTPDALENMLQAMRLHTQKRLHLVFGCGGDRDAGKRPEMGAIAEKYADIIIVTDDNPRNESAAEIRRQILDETRTAADIGDRAQAITDAVNGLEAGDILVIAGKGHEQGQIVGEQTIPFDDLTHAQAALAKVTS